MLRPPVEFDPGWHAILGWVMAAVGFAAAWLGLEVRRPAMGLVAALPVVGLGAISLPESQQLATGLVALVLFGPRPRPCCPARSAGRNEQERRAARAFEMRRGLRALPLVGLVTVLLYFAAQSSFLFPDPIYDPAEEARLPKSDPALRGGGPRAVHASRRVHGSMEDGEPRRVRRRELAAGPPFAAVG